MFAACVAGLILASAFPGSALANDFTGVWQGTWTSSFGGAGSLNVSLTQTGSNVNGTVTITNTTCGTFADLSLTGTVSGNIGVFQAFAFCPLDGSSNDLRFADAELSGNIVTGNYTIFSNGFFFDSGTFVLTRSVNIITAMAGTGGTISPSGSVQLSAGASRTFNITPNNGFSISDVLVDGASVGVVPTFTFPNVAANHTIEARFVANAVITATAGPGGTISPTGSVAVSPGANQTFTITPDPGFGVADILVNGTSVGAVASFTFFNVTANHTIEATFAANAVITATAGPGGTISPTGSVAVSPGANQTFDITPNSGFAVSRVIVDGNSIGPVTEFTFTNVTSDHTIEASFFEVYPAIAPALQLIIDGEGAQ